MEFIRSIHTVRDHVRHICSLQTIRQMADATEQRLLNSKIRFPLLEEAADLFYDHLGEEDAVNFAEKIISFQSIGGLVIAGKILQRRPEKNFSKSVSLAGEWMMLSDEWYACDILGERVAGHGLLCWPERGKKELKKIAAHQHYWVVRSTGVAVHYAVKKGLAEKDVEYCFRLLLSLSDAKHYHIKTGIGWGAKTCAKFHPEMVRAVLGETKNKIVPGPWFMTKVKIGLGRSEYVRMKKLMKKK